MLKDALWGTIRDGVALFLLSFATNRVFIGGARDPMFGEYTYPILMMALLALAFSLRYLPQMLAHRKLERWLGLEYQAVLDQELAKSSYGRLMREGWFLKYLWKKEESQPTIIERIRNKTRSDDQ